MSRITVKQIAEQANVSVMAVSRALRGLDGVSKSTREKILDIASHVGYIPSPEARALRSGSSAAVNSTPCIGLVFGSDTQFADSFFCSVTRGVEKKAAEYGYCPIQIHIDDSFENSWTRLKSAFSVANFCGSLMVGQFNKSDFEFISQQTDNVIVVDGPAPENTNTCCAAVDYAEGSKLALQHLLDKNCKNILVITGPANHYFSKSMKTASQLFTNKFENLAIVESDYIGLSAIKIIKEKAAERFTFDGVFTNDELALGVIRGLAECNIRCPEDVKVVGFDDIPFSQLSTPKLTSVSVDKRTLGVLAVEMLNEIIKGNPDTANINRIVKPKLIIRESSQ